MPQVDREGLYRSMPGATATIEESAGGAMCVLFKFTISEYLNGATWEDWSTYGLHAFARVYFVRKDGTVNDRGVETLRDVIGWNGDPATISTLDVPAVQLNVKSESYNGLTQFKVAWINPFDYEPGPKEVSPELLAKINKMYGSRLRAAFGVKGKPAPATASKPAPTPSAQKATKSPPLQTKSAPATPVPGCTKDEAWAHWLSWDAAKWGEAEVADAWTKHLVKAFPDKGDADMTPADWLAVKESASNVLLPF